MGSKRARGLIGFDISVLLSSPTELIACRKECIVLHETMGCHTALSATIGQVYRPEECEKITKCFNIPSFFTTLLTKKPSGFDNTSSTSTILLLKYEL